MPESPPQSPPPSRRHKLGVIFLTIFLDLVGFSVIFPLFPAMLEWYLATGTSDGLLGVLVRAIQSVSPDGSDLLTIVLFGGVLGSLYSLLQFAAAPVWGRLSDRYGRRHVLMITVSGTALGYLLWIFSGQFWVLVLSRAICGVMAGNIAVATAAVADVTEGEQRTKGMAFVGVAFALGFIIGPAIGGISTRFVDPADFAGGSPFTLNPFSVAAGASFALALLNLLWVSLRFRETLDPAHRHDDTDASNRGLRAIFLTRNPAVRSAIRVYFIFMVAFAGMEFTLTFLALERLDYGPAQMVWLFLFIGLVLIITQGYFVRKYAGRFGEVNLLLGGILSGGIGLYLLAGATAAPMFYCGLVLMSVGIGLSSPTTTALVSFYSNPREQGRDIGALRSAGALARAVGPIAAALGFWWLGSAPAYFSGAGVLIACMFLALFLPKPVVRGRPRR